MRSRRRLKRQQKKSKRQLGKSKSRQSAEGGDAKTSGVAATHSPLGAEPEPEYMRPDGERDDEGSGVGDILLAACPPPATRSADRGDGGRGGTSPGRHCHFEVTAMTARLL